MGGNLIAGRNPHTFVGCNVFQGLGQVLAPKRLTDHKRMHRLFLERCRRILSEVDAIEPAGSR